jgi:hypothetical protein
LRPFIRHRSFANPTKNRENANTSILCSIFVLQYVPLVKNNGSVMSSEVETSRDVA